MKINVRSEIRVRLCFSDSDSNMRKSAHLNSNQLFTIDTINLCIMYSTSFSRTRRYISFKTKDIYRCLCEFYEKFY